MDNFRFLLLRVVAARAVIPLVVVPVTTGAAPILMVIPSVDLMPVRTNYYFQLEWLLFLDTVYC